MLISISCRNQEADLSASADSIYKLCVISCAWTHRSDAYARDRAGRIRRKGAASLVRLSTRADAGSPRLAPRCPTLRQDLWPARPQRCLTNASPREQALGRGATALHFAHNRSERRTADVALGCTVGICSTSSSDERHHDCGPCSRTRGCPAAHDGVAAESVCSCLLSCPPIAKRRLTKFSMPYGCAGPSNQYLRPAQNSSGHQCDHVPARCTCAFAEVADRHCRGRLASTRLSGVRSDDGCISVLGDWLNFLGCAPVARVVMVCVLLPQPHQAFLLKIPGGAIAPDLHRTTGSANLNRSAD